MKKKKVLKYNQMSQIKDEVQKYMLTKRKREICYVSGFVYLSIYRITRRLFLG